MKNAADLRKEIGHLTDGVQFFRYYVRIMPTGVAWITPHYGTEKRFNTLSDRLHALGYNVVMKENVTGGRIFGMSGRQGDRFIEIVIK